MTMGMRSRGSQGGGQFGGRGRGQKPPLMSRPMPPSFPMRRPVIHPPPQRDPWSMEPRFGPPGNGRGMPIPRGRLRGGRGMRLPFGRMPRGARGGYFHPPMHTPMGPRMFRGGPSRLMGPSGMFRGRGFPQRGRGAKFSKPGRGKTQKVKVDTPTPIGEMNKPWVTEAMKNEILKKRKLHQKAKKVKTIEDWEVFKEHRNLVTTMLREAKLEYIGAHPEEDVDKILAEASVSETKNDVNETDPPNLEEPMEEGANTGDARLIFIDRLIPVK